jgi:uroporphyrinogen decarboxylase
MGESRVRAVLRGETAVPVPVWLMRQAGRYLPEYRALREKAREFLDFCFRPELAVEATLQPLRRYNLDAAIIFSDILVVPHALGRRVEFLEGEGPRVDPVKSLADVRGLQPEGMAERLEPVYRAMAEVRARLPEEKSLIGFAGSPWTLAVYLLEGQSGFGGSVAKGIAAANRDLISRLLELLVEAVVAHLDRQVIAGADVVQLFDSWAGAPDAAGFERWVIEPTKAVVRQFRVRHPGVPVIGFPRGAGSGYARYAAVTGVDGLSLDSQVRPAWAREHLGFVKTLQGNLDNVWLRQGGPDMLGRADDILNQLGRRPFIFNLGHGVLPETNPDAVATLVEHVRAWRS